jgi:hypothetical protein
VSECFIRLIFDLIVYHSTLFIDTLTICLIGISIMQSFSVSQVLGGYNDGNVL